MPSAPALELSHSRAGQHVRMEPASLSYGPRPLCIAAVETVDIINVDDDNDVAVTSISTDNVHFHLTAIQQTTVPPGGRLSVTVIFLPRLLGKVEGTLSVETSAGNFFYRMTASGSPNAYSINPFLGAKVPTSSPYTPSIRLYNPHDNLLQVKEVYSSEGFLQLNLPNSSNPSEAASVTHRCRAARSRTSPMSHVSVQ